MATKGVRRGRQSGMATRTVNAANRVNYMRLGVNFRARTSSNAANGHVLNLSPRNAQKVRGSR